MAHDLTVKVQSTEDKPIPGVMFTALFSESQVLFVRTDKNGGASLAIPPKKPGQATGTILLSFPTFVKNDDKIFELQATSNLIEVKSGTASNSVSVKFKLVSSLEARMTAAEDSIQTHSVDFARIEKSLDSQNDSIEVTKKALQAVSDDVKKLHESQEVSKKAVEKLDDSVNRLSAEIQNEVLGSDSRLQKTLKELPATIARQVTDQVSVATGGLTAGKLTEPLVFPDPSRHVNFVTPISLKSSPVSSPPSQTPAASPAALSPQTKP